jgi:NAD(P)-dependent dehydrogenase (short-subunit alcohol dehydrogenase family)
MTVRAEFHPEHDTSHSDLAAFPATPLFDDPDYRPARKLQGKVALISGGGDSLGRAVSIIYAKEGALLVLIDAGNSRDIEETKRCAERYGAEVLVVKGNLDQKDFARDCVRETIEYFGQLDILVNNDNERHLPDTQLPVSQTNLQKQFEAIFLNGMKLTHEAMKYMPAGSAVINTSPITAYRGDFHYMDFAVTQNAMSTMMRAMSVKMIQRGIRMNAVAPGPIWTSTIIATFTAEEMAAFGKKTPMQRPGHPCELGPVYVYLACNDSSYVSGQTLHINDQEITAH